MRASKIPYNLNQKAYLGLKCVLNSILPVLGQPETRNRAISLSLSLDSVEYLISPSQADSISNSVTLKRGMQKVT